MKGENLNEAIYRVGYNCLAQFNRRYKRQFGLSPSSTLAATGA